MKIINILIFLRSGNLLWISPAFQKEIDEKLADKLTKIMQLNKILDEKLKQKRELLEKNALEEAKKAGLVEEKFLRTFRVFSEMRGKIL